MADFSKKLWASAKRGQKTSLSLGNLRPAEGATWLGKFSLVPENKIAPGK